MLLLALASILPCRGETLDLDFTTGEPSLPDGWTNNSGEVSFRETGLYFNNNGSISTGVFYKVSGIDFSVKTNKNKAYIILEFLRPDGVIASAVRSGEITPTTKSVSFADGEFPAEENYSVRIRSDEVYVKGLTITYDESPSPDDVVSSFVFSNYFFTEDDNSVVSSQMESGGVRLSVSGNAVSHMAMGDYVEFSGDGRIEITAPLITKVEVGTALGTSVLINGEETRAWEGVSNGVTVTPPSGEPSRILGVAIYTKRLAGADENLSAVIDGPAGGYYVVNLPLQGMAVGEEGVLYARTVSDDACSAVSENTGEATEYDDDPADFIQRDWVALDFNSIGLSAGDYAGQCIKPGLVGRKKDDSSPTLEVLLAPGIDSENQLDYTTNTYALRNFYGDAETGAFVVRPQVNEYATVTGTITGDEQGGFAISDPDGSLAIDNSRGVVKPLHVGSMAHVQGMVKARPGNPASGETPESTGFLFYATGISDVVSTGIDGVEGSGADVYGSDGLVVFSGHGRVSAEIFDISGRLLKTVKAEAGCGVQMPAGCYVVRMLTGDGKVLNKKVLVR